MILEPTKNSRISSFSLIILQFWYMVCSSGSSMDIYTKNTIWNLFTIFHLKFFDIFTHLTAQSFTVYRFIKGIVNTHDFRWLRHLRQNLIV